MVELHASLCKNDEKCENFNAMLNTTWRMGIINSIYICSESENTTLYTLNPITNYAPDPWKRMEDLKDISNIYHQIFDRHTSCNNLNYDKTKVLNGYQIKTILSLPPEDEVGAGSWPNPKPLLYLNEFMKIQLNASVIFEEIHRHSPWRHKKRIGDPNADVTFCELTAAETLRFSPLFFEKDDQCVAVVKSHDRTVLYKIRHLWSSQVLCISAISLIILYFILRMKNNEVTSVILDIIRFLICVSIGTDTRGNSFRIYFTTMLIFIVITNGGFQGEITAFLTKSDKVPPIETVEELTELGYHFHVFYPSCTRILSGWRLTRSNEIESFHNILFIDYILNNPLNACIISSWLYEHLRLLKPLSHTNPRVEIVYPYSWISRHDWPVYERFNLKLMQIFESGIYAVKEKVFFRLMKDKGKADDHELALAAIESPYRPIELANLDLAFKLLAIGLSIVMFVLMIELRMREI